MKSKRWVLAVMAVSWLCACGVQMIPTHDDWYAMHYFLMQDYERQAYKELTDNGRLEFQKVYWESRPPRVKEEFDLRMEFITQNYKNENSAQPWNTDRARIYLLNGRPAGIEFKQNDAWPTGVVITSAAAAGVTEDRSNEDIQARTLEVWSYPYGNYIVLYGFTFQQPNKWRQAQISTGGARYLQALERESRTEFWSPANEEAYKARLEELKAIK